MARTMTHPTRSARRPQKKRSRIGLVPMLLVAVAAIAALVVLFTVVLGGKGSSVSVSGPVRTTQLMAGDEVPSFSGPGLTGGRVDWEQFRGSPTVLVVWAPWCPHCQVELPILGEVSKQFPDIQVVTVESAIKNVCIVGGPDEVLQQLHDLWDLTGGFGTLLMIAHDWDDKAKWMRSMDLLAKEIVPALPTLEKV